VGRQGRSFKDNGPNAIKRKDSFTTGDINFLIEQCQFSEDSELCAEYSGFTLNEAVKESLEQDLSMYEVNVNPSLMPHMHMPLKSRINRKSSIQSRPSLRGFYPYHWTVEEFDKNTRMGSLKKRKKRPVLSNLLCNLNQTYLKGTGHIDDKGYHDKGFATLVELVFEKIYSEPRYRRSKKSRYSVNDAIKNMRKIFYKS